MSSPGSPHKKLLHPVTAVESGCAIDDKSHIKSCVPLSHQLSVIKKENMKLNSYISQAILVRRITFNEFLSCNFRCSSTAGRNSNSRKEL